MEVPPSQRQGTLQDVMEEIMRQAERGRLRARAAADWPLSQNVEVQTREEQQRAFDARMKDNMEAFRSVINQLPKRDKGVFLDPAHAEVEKHIQMPVPTEPRNLKQDLINVAEERARIAKLGEPIGHVKKADRIYTNNSSR